MIQQKTNFTYMWGGILRDQHWKLINHDSRQDGWNNALLCVGGLVWIENIVLEGGGLICSQVAPGSVIRNIKITDAWADAIHVIDGSSGLSIYDIVAERNGDDVVSVVSGANEKICEDILFSRIHAVDNKARGCSVVGGNRVRFEHGRFLRQHAFGLYAFSEPAYNTHGCDDVEFSDIWVKSCGQKNRESLGDGCRVGGRDGYPVKNIRLTNRCILEDCGRYGINVGDNYTDPMYTDHVKYSEDTFFNGCPAGEYNYNKP